MATTMYPANATAANASGPTTRDDSANAGAAIQSTIQGESSASAGRDPGRESTRYVSTYAYVRRASRSSSIEYANAGQARRNAVSRSAIAEAMRTPTE